MTDYGHDLEFGYFLIPDHGDPARTLTLARTLDELGYDLIGIQDHPYQPAHFDTMSLIGVILGQTSRVRLFPDVANLPLRHPAMLAKAAALAAEVQLVTGQTVEVGFVDRGYTGEKPAAAAQEHGLRLEVIKLAEAKRGFVLLPRRWVIERAFAWAARFRRLAKDYERLPEVVAGLHFLAFVRLMLHRLVTTAVQSP